MTSEKDNKFTMCVCGATAKWHVLKGMFVCDVCLTETPKKQEGGEQMKSRECPKCKTMNEWNPDVKSYLCECGTKYRNTRSDKGKKKDKKSAKKIDVVSFKKEKFVKQSCKPDQCQSCGHKEVCGLTPQCEHYIAG